MIGWDLCHLFFSVDFLTSCSFLSFLFPPIMELPGFHSLLRTLAELEYVPKRESGSPEFQINGLFLRSLCWIGFYSNIHSLGISARHLGSIPILTIAALWLHGLDQPIVNGPIWLGICNRPSHGPSLPFLLGFLSFGSKFTYNLFMRSALSIFPIWFHIAFASIWYFILAKAGRKR